MSRALSLAAPSLRLVTDDALRALVGDQSLRRGQAFARQQRATRLRADGPLALSGTVRGDTGTYQVRVWLRPDGTVRAGDCTCPIGGDCKHVVAAVLEAQRAVQIDRAARAAGPASRAAVASVIPQWERALAAALSPPAAEGADLALHIDVQPESAGPTRLRARARPLVVGARGWVKTGISWSRLGYGAYAYGGPVLNPGQAEALHRLMRATSPRFVGFSSSEWVDLATLGTGWVDVLAACERAGVTLLTAAKHSGRVRVAHGTARVGFDVVRGVDGGVTLTPGVRFPDDLSRDLRHDPADARNHGGEVLTWSPLGLPATAIVARQGVGADSVVLIAGFDPPLPADIVALLDHGCVPVPASDTRRFVAEALPALARRFSVDSPDGSVEVSRPRPPRLRLELEHLPGPQLALAWSFHYDTGSSDLDIPLDGTGHEGLRDRVAEAALVASLDAADLPSAVLRQDGAPGQVRPHPRSTIDRFAVVGFMAQTLPCLAALDGVDVVVVGEPVAFTESPEPPVVALTLADADTGAAPDWFDLSIEVSVAGRPVPLADVITALTLGHDHVVLADGTWFRVDRPELARLREILAEARAMSDEDGVGRARLSPFQADLWAELESLGVVRDQSERWRELVTGLTGAGAGPLDAPAGLRATLRRYQHEGFEWLTFLRRHGLGGVLADDMGLGKTVQALAMILAEREEDGPAEGPWLIVAPTSVMTGWAGEAARFAPTLRVTVLAETSRRRGAPVADAAAACDVVVTSYAILRLDNEEFCRIGWGGVILDEAQAAKNHRSSTYQGIRKLRAGARFAVTGTPMENNLMELWALLSIVAPGLFPDPQRFTEHYRRPIEQGTAPERLHTLRRRIRPLMLRRTKQAVAADLPPKQEQQITVDLPPAHRRVYDRVLARERQRVLGLLDDVSRNRIAIFRSLTRLRQASLHPALIDEGRADSPCVKIDSLVEMLGPVVAEGHQALVFSQFTSFLALVRERLDADGLAYSYLSGQTRDRPAAIDRFRRGDAPVFLVSLKAGGTGLTLTEADYVFLLDPWWNPAVEAQAVDRAHRIGQDKHVNVYRLVAADTIEEKVVALQQRKRELFAGVVDSGALAGGSLTVEDIRQLLGDGTPPSG